MTETKPKVSIVIVTWNNEKDIVDCVNSLLKQSYPTEEIIIVDNLSSDNTVKIIEEKFKDFKKVNLIKSDRNTFFTGGHNMGMKAAMQKDIDFLAIINPDTKADSDWIEKSIEVALPDKQIGMVGPKIKFWKNKFEGKINSAGMIYDGFMQGYDRGFEEEDKGQYDEIEEVKAVTGAAILFRVKMLKEIGLFWTPLKMYLEDLEISIRARKQGWKIIYTPFTTVHHKWMQSTNQSKIIKLNDWKMRNWLYIAMRHYSFKSKLAVLKEYVKSRL